jgi:uncharacterized membrane protein YphA (DoxX/SURF4 family)/peroxiredoxin
MSESVSHQARPSNEWPTATGNLTLALRSAAAAVFLFAAVGKLLDFAGLLRSITRLGWVPDAFIPTTAALLVVAELTAGLLLLSGRGTRLGAFIGGAMAAAFTAVTARLMLQGVGQGCDCFGLFIKLPPWTMLGVDLGLFLACLSLLCRTACAPGSASDSTAGELDAATVLRRLRAPAHRLPSLGLSLYLVAMVVGLQVGFDRAPGRAAARDPRVMTLRYGDPAPDFLLHTLMGVPVSPSSLRGKWSLISFAEPGCDSCDRQLADIAARYPAWRSRLNVLAVLVGKTVFLSPQSVAHRLVRRLKLPMAVACDTASTVAGNYGDRPLRTPFSVLMDDKGYIRFIEDGYLQNNCGHAVDFGLVSSIDAMLQDRPFSRAAVAGYSLTYGRRAPDGNLWVGQHRRLLSSLWRNRALLLTFLAADCPACPGHVASLERALGRSPSISAVYVYPQWRQAFNAARALPANRSAAADPGGVVAADYQVGDLPATFFIRDGRLLYASGPRSSPGELDRLLRGGAPAASPGLPLLATTQTARR